MMNLHAARPFSAMPRRQRGAVLVLVVGALLAIVVMGALAMDGGHMLLNKARLQNAVDAAALSGAKTLSKALDNPEAYKDAVEDARETFLANANATGNAELKEAIDKAIGVEGSLDQFVEVKFSGSVYGDFKTVPDSAVRYVQVSVPDFPLTGFFWNVMNLPLIGDGKAPVKAVAAYATAGPSPTAAPCDLSPLVVCGVNQPGTFFGYKFGDLKVLKTAADDTSLAAGNYQLLDFGNGGKTVGELLAGGGAICPEIGSNATTKPGNTVGQAISGVNTRMNLYDGSFNNTQNKYPPDLIVDYDKVGSDPALSLDANGVIVYGAKNSSNGNGGGGGKGGNGNGGGGGSSGSAGIPVSTDAGNIYYTDPVTNTKVPLFDYNNWKEKSDACVLDGSQCTNGGVFERRILKIVVGNCNGLTGGATKVPVLGFGCFFLVQPGIHTGGDAQIFGQFIEQCEGDGVAGPTPSDDQGPMIIQLYKTFLQSGPNKDS